MPVYQVGDLCNPRSDIHIEEDNPDAIGLITELRSMPGRPPEAKVLWNDMLDVGPKWTLISDIMLIKGERDGN